MSASPIVTGAGEAIGAAFAEPDRTPHSLWEHCRNNLGIARLLVHEGRPRVLVETACRICAAHTQAVFIPTRHPGADV